MKSCPCGSGKLFIKCCKPYLTGKAQPQTAEQLMRARYSAYTRADIDYIQSTMSDQLLTHFDADQAKQWAQSVKWIGLKIMSTTGGGPEDSSGTVSFLANYVASGSKEHMHENSKFKKVAGQWLYVGSNKVTGL